MVCVAAAVVAYSAAHSFRQGVQVAYQLFDALAGEIVVAFERGVEFGDVGGVMLAVVNFHGLRINVRLQRVMRVGEIG